MRLPFGAVYFVKYSKAKYLGVEVFRFLVIGTDNSNVVQAF